MKLSNKFTFTRIIFAPIFFILYFLPIWFGVGTKITLLVAVPCLIFAEFTDYLDGAIARKKNLVTNQIVITIGYDIKTKVKISICYFSIENLKMIERFYGYAVADTVIKNILEMILW